MSHFIIDGYNVVKQLPELMDRKLREGREELVKILQYAKPQGNNRVTVVFDGTDDGFINSTAQIKGYNIGVAFSQGESADDRIRHLVKRDSSPNGITVVTDDRDLRSSVKIHGAKVLFVKEFIKPKEKQSKTPNNRIKNRIPQNEQIEINDELKKLWRI